LFKAWDKDLRKGASDLPDSLVHVLKGTCQYPYVKDKDDWDKELDDAAAVEKFASSDLKGKDLLQTIVLRRACDELGFQLIIARWDFEDVEEHGVGDFVKVKAYTHVGNDDVVWKEIRKAPSHLETCGFVEPFLYGKELPPTGNTEDLDRALS